MEDQGNQSHSADQVTETFPPNLSGVVTECESEVVPFPGFLGGRAICLRFKLGHLAVNLHFPPQAADGVVEVIEEAKKAAARAVEPASMDTLRAMTKNGDGPKP